jgi:hypothetical protein
MNTSRKKCLQKGTRGIQTAQWAGTAAAGAGAGAGMLLRSLAMSSNFWMCLARKSPSPRRKERK